MAHNVHKMFSSKTEPVHGIYYSSEKFPIIVSYHMFGVNRQKKHFGIWTILSRTSKLYQRH